MTQDVQERVVYSPALKYEQRKTVYQGQDIQIVQVLPKFLEMGQDTALRVEIIYTGQQKFSFEYELELTFLTNEEGNRVRIAFQGNESGKGGKYQMEIPLRIACVSNVQAQASLVRDSFRLQIGNKTYSDAKPCISQASVNDVDDYEALQIQYYRTAMDYIMGNTFHQGIYLAKIYVVRAGNICLIERIEQLSFQAFLQLKTEGKRSSEPNDPLYGQVKEFVIAGQRASASLIQRHFRLSFARASRLLDQLEESGVVGPANGSRPRKILIQPTRKSKKNISSNQEQ